MTTDVRPVVKDKYCKGRDCVSTTKVDIERICEIGAIRFMDSRTLDNDGDSKRSLKSDQGQANEHE